MAYAVPHGKVLDDVGLGKTINQLVTMFIKPELNRRGRFDFRAAIIEMFDDGRDPIVHLDSEAKFMLGFRQGSVSESDVGKIKSVSLKDIESIHAVEEGMDPDSAKVFIIKWGKPKITHWVLSYDFRYNKGTAKEKLARATEFVAAAKLLNPGDHFHVMIYLIWSALELLLDVRLYLLPNHKPAPFHKDRDKKLKKLSASTNIFSDDFCKAYTLFSRRKNKARYGEKVTVTRSFNISYFATTIAMLEVDIASINL